MSISAFQPSGLISGLLLGARPSTKLSTTNCIFSLSRQSNSCVGKQLFSGLGTRQIGLHDSVQQRILLPRGVDEAFVGARRNAVRLADGDIAELTGQRANTVGDGTRVLGKVAGEAGPGGVRHHPAGEWLGGAGEQQVEWGGQLVDFGRGFLGFGVLAIVIVCFRLSER